MSGTLTGVGAGVGTAISPGLGTAVGAGLGYLADNYAANGANGNSMYTNIVNSVKTANKYDIFKQHFDKWKEHWNKYKAAFCKEEFGKPCGNVDDDCAWLAVRSIGHDMSAGFVWKSPFRSGIENDWLKHKDLLPPELGGTGGSGTGGSNTSGNNNTAMAGLGGNLTMSIIGTVILAIAVFFIYKKMK